MVETMAPPATARARPKTPSGSAPAALGWGALVLAGQGAALALIEAGPAVQYQHLRAARLLAPATMWAGVVLALQLAAGALALRRSWPAVRAWLADTFGPWRLAALAALFALTSATLSRSPLGTAVEICLATLVQLGALLCALAFARALPGAWAARLTALGDRVLGPRGRTAAEPGGVDAFAARCALWVLAVTALLAVVAYERHPHIPDEVAYVLQARYLAEGMIAMPAPAVPDAFSVDLMWYEPARWFSPFPPGWPALLAVGEMLGAPWLVNPLLGAVNVLLAYVFLRELYPRRTARLATVLLSVSPWQLFMTMSLMSHTFSLCATLVAALAVARLRRTGRLRWAWVGGAAIGLVGLMRPLEGLAVAGLLGLWTLVGKGQGWRRLRVVPTAVLTVGAMLVGAMVLPYNRALIGSPFRFPVMAYFDTYYGPGVNDIGFGRKRGVGWPIDPFPGHGPLEAIANADMNAFAINVELLGWATGSLLVLGAFVLGAHLRRADWLMLAAVAAIVGLHSLYWFSGGPDFGARYWYLVIIPCIVLTARGLDWLAVGATPRAQPAAVLLTLGALLLFVPWRAADKYHHYREVRPDVRELAREHAFGRSLVLVQGTRFPDYASAIVHNPADVRDPDAPVYVWDRNQAVRAAVLRAYADRPVWIVQGSGVTGGAFRVAGGPWSARQALEMLPPNDGRFDRTDGNARGVVERAPARGRTP